MSDVLLDLGFVDAPAGLDAWAARLDGLRVTGVACSWNVFQLREQHVPATPLGDALHAAVVELMPAAGAIALQPGPDVRRLAATRYARLMDCGRPEPAGDAGPPSAMFVLTHPTDLAYDADFNAWYSDEHLPDVALSPHFRSGTRYRPSAQLAGAPLGYLAIYEIEKPYSPELHAGLNRWQLETEVLERVAMPNTPGGEPMLTVDLWAYFERVRWSR